MEDQYESKISFTSWDNGILLLPLQEATASEVVFSVPEMLLNDAVVPIGGATLALVRRSDASVALLDVVSGTVAMPNPIESLEIKVRSPAPPSIVKHESRTVTRNALKSVASDGIGGILISPTGHPFHQSIVLQINSQAAVTRTHRLLMAQWDDLKSPSNPNGYMQGNIILKTSKRYLWLNQEEARIAFYEAI